MTLKEAIEHCEEVSETCSNTECAKEHLQLVTWLKELQFYRDKYQKSNKTMKLIDKDALLAEIERRIEHNTEWKDACKTLAVLAANQAIEEDKKILSIIDTLEAKEVKKNCLTWRDIKLISEIGLDFMNSENSDNLSEEDYYKEILNRFKAQKGE